ncbi:Acetyltransferase (GNAT) family protein [Nonomuraea maritima]|uniref:Acetyltransferase (GNAT) family protein n=1 Tax=Nonomuraea maritima TaxID=683260 RepID=A0A1G9NL73_9ACTN|nr:GNAT family N-acetyltransferase [Nonomuraea maritima]SDL87104.1 Acetyltransferase (GNAT) family protein [Nonomuraea maritima]
MNFDLLVHEAWPAYEQRPHDGWLLRYAGGVTKRANSVLAVDQPSDLDGAIRAAEAFYAERGQRCVFSIGPGVMPGLDEELGRRGYAEVDPTYLMTRSQGAGHPCAVGAVRIEERPWDGWLETWWAVDGRFSDGLSVAERVCTGVPAWYAAYEEDGRVLSVGRGVPQGDTLGIYCMATLPEARRKGLARTILRALTRHAGVGSAYLVVTEKNTAAQKLYRSEGFEITTGYHYRVR